MREETGGEDGGDGGVDEGSGGGFTAEGFGYRGREYKVSGQEVGWRRGHAARGAACRCQGATGERAREWRGGVAQRKADVSPRGCATRKTM